MTSRAAVLSLPAALFRTARQKVLLRWIVVRRGIASGIFWTFVAIIGSWFRHSDWPGPFTLLMGLWLGLSLPMLYYQLSVIVDMLGYVFTGKITFYPLLKAASEAKTDDERHRIQLEMLPSVLANGQSGAVAEPGRLMRGLVSFIGTTSPLSCFSTWALVVLVRLPESTHHRISARKVITIQHQNELRVYNQALARISHRQGDAAA